MPVRAKTRAQSCTGRANTGSTGHDLTRYRKKGVWYPELVGLVKSYPETQEAWQLMSDSMRARVKIYNAQGISRRGVPDGWGQKKKLIARIKAAATADAVRIVETMIEEKKFEPDCREARLAMEKAVEILCAEKHTPDSQPVPLYGTTAVLTAMKTILEYTQRKPVAKNEITLSKAEDFLAALVASPA